MKLCKKFIEDLNCPNNENCPYAHIDVKTLLKTELEAQLYGNQWPLSSFGPFSQKPSLPHYIEDQSFEEMRLMYYDSDLSFFETRKKCSETFKKAANQMNSLMTVDENVLQQLVDIYERTGSLNENYVQQEPSLKEGEKNDGVFIISRKQEQTAASIEFSDSSLTEKEQPAENSTVAELLKPQKEQKLQLLEGLSIKPKVAAKDVGFFGIPTSGTVNIAKYQNNHPKETTPNCSWAQKEPSPTKFTDNLNVPKRWPIDQTQQVKNVGFFGIPYQCINTQNEKPVQQQDEGKIFGVPNLPQNQQHKTQDNSYSCFSVPQPQTQKEKNRLPFSAPATQPPSIFDVAKPVVQQSKSIVEYIIYQQQKKNILPLSKVASTPSMFGIAKPGSIGVSEQQETQGKSAGFCWGSQTQSQPEKCLATFDAPAIQPGSNPSIFGIVQPSFKQTKSFELLAPKQPAKSDGFFSPVQANSFGLFEPKQHQQHQENIFRNFSFSPQQQPKSINFSSIPQPKQQQVTSGVGLTTEVVRPASIPSIFGFQAEANLEQPTSIFGFESPAKQQANKSDGLFGPKQPQQPDIRSLTLSKQLPEAGHDFHFGLLPPQQKSREENNLRFFSSLNKERDEEPSGSSGRCDHCQVYLKEIADKIDNLSRVFDVNNVFLKRSQEQEMKFIIDSLKQSVAEKLVNSKANKTAPQNVHALIITPKEEQTSEKTKTEIQNKIDPFDAQIDSVTKSFGGSLVIKCKNVDSIEKLQTQVKAKCGEKYDLEIFKNENRAQIVVKGIDSQVDDSKLIEIIKKQNDLNGQMELIKCFGKAHKLSRHNAIIAVDENLYKQLKDANLSCLYVGWNKCYLSWRKSRKLNLN